MKYRLLTLLGLIALSGASMPAWSQDYDDVYYDAKKDNGEKTILKPAATQVKSQPQRVVVSGSQPYKVTIQSGSNIVNGRDVDEYNRRNGYEYYDTTGYASALDENQGDFSNTQRIERFYNPDIVINSNDNDLITLYYDSAPTVNLTIGSSWWGPSIGWGWSGWYGPRWSYSYYDPWFYSSWYGPHWYAGWSWGWYDPLFSWGWGWGGPGYHWGWDGPGHHWGWGGPGPRPNDWAWGRGHGWNSRNEGGRRPMGYALGNSGRSGYASANGSNSVAGRRPMNISSNNRNFNYNNNSGSTSNGGVRTTTVTGHRGASSSTGNVNTTNNAGNMNRANVGNVSSMGRRPASNNSSSTASRVYVPSTQRRSTESVSNSSRSSSSWNTTRSNSSSSSWGGSRSWGGSSSGSFGGGGFSGGGGHSGGFSGGGGHRR